MRKSDAALAAARFADALKNGADGRGGAGESDANDEEVGDGAAARPARGTLLWASAL